MDITESMVPVFRGSITVVDSMGETDLETFEL